MAIDPEVQILIDQTIAQEEAKTATAVSQARAEEQAKTEQAVAQARIEEQAKIAQTSKEDQTAVVLQIKSRLGLGG